MRRKLFLVSVCVAILSFPFLIYGGEYTCGQGYPHVPKKDGTYDNRANDLWELAQDWVHYRGQILRCNQRGDTDGLRKAQQWFQKTNNWLNAYPQNHVSKALELAEKCYGR
jgi:hypothetical protein